MTCFNAQPRSIPMEWYHTNNCSKYEICIGAQLKNWWIKKSSTIFQNIYPWSLSFWFLFSINSSGIFFAAFIRYIVFLLASKFFKVHHSFDNTSSSFHFTPVSFRFRSIRIVIACSLSSLMKYGRCRWFESSHHNICGGENKNVSESPFWWVDIYFSFNDFYFHFCSDLISLLFLSLSLCLK